MQLYNAVQLNQLRTCFVYLKKTPECTPEYQRVMSTLIEFKQALVDAECYEQCNQLKQIEEEFEVELPFLT